MKINTVSNKIRNAHQENHEFSIMCQVKSYLTESYARIDSSRPSTKYNCNRPLNKLPCRHSYVLVYGIQVIKNVTM